MAITEFVYLQGKCKWAKLISPNDYQKWVITLYPNPESLEKVRELQAEGMKNILKKDEDGYNITFNRPLEKIYASGRRTGFDPPAILWKDSKPMKDPPQIGNGSDVTIKLEVYSHGIPNSQRKAKAARLLTVKIDNLVPYVRDSEEQEQRAAKGLDQQPEQLF